jgi:hypothetical protein
MGTYDHLPVYKECYDLLVSIFTTGRYMQRDYRYTLGESLKKELVSLMTAIYRANCRRAKKELLLQAREHLEVSRLLLRLCYELKQLPLKSFVSSSEKMESIGRQLTAWERSCRE